MEAEVTFLVVDADTDAYYRDRGMAISEDNVQTTTTTSVSNTNDTRHDTADALNHAGEFNSRYKLS